MYDIKKLQPIVKYNFNKDSSKAGYDCVKSCMRRNLEVKEIIIICCFNILRAPPKILLDLLVNLYKFDKARAYAFRNQNKEQQTTIQNLNSFG